MTRSSDLRRLPRISFGRSVVADQAFTDYSLEEFRSFVSTNLEGFIFITQLVVKQLLKQNGGGSVTTIPTSLVDNPIAGAPSSIPMITKGGLNAVTVSLASEYATSTSVSTQWPPVSSTPPCTRTTLKTY